MDTLDGWRGIVTAGDRKAAATRKLLMAVYHQWIADGKPKRSEQGASNIASVLLSMGVRVNDTSRT
jgi:hypothetical protein